MSSKYKILFVEDETDLLEMYRIKLCSIGFEVYTAMNGEVGLLLAEKCSPDMILLDIVMPKIEGFEMLKRLKKNPSTKKIPVIIFSNLSQKEEVDKGFKLGAKDYIVKTSVTPVELAERIKKFLNSQCE